jgi:hypothetical protein
VSPFLNQQAHERTYQFMSTYQLAPHLYSPSPQPMKFLRPVEQPAQELGHNVEDFYNHTQESLAKLAATGETRDTKQLACALDGLTTSNKLAFQSINEQLNRLENHAARKRSWLG